MEIKFYVAFDVRHVTNDCASGRPGGNETVRGGLQIVDSALPAVPSKAACISLLFKRGIYVDPKRADIVPVQSQREIEESSEQRPQAAWSQLAFKDRLCKECKIFSKCRKQLLYLVVVECHEIQELLNCGNYLNC